MFPYKFTKITNRHVLAVNHRKALTPSTAFPAQLLDLLVGYAYLLSLGFAFENVTLIGNSSGGYSYLALSRYLAELDRMQPDLDVDLPGVMLLMSPICDLSHPPVSSRATDYLVPSLNQRAYPSMTRYFLPSAVQTSPYFSPAVCGSFAYLSKYKTVARSSPTVDRTRSLSRCISTPPPRLESSGTAEEAPGKKFLREWFKARCLSCAVKDRERKISGKGRASDWPWSSDGPDETMDWDDEDEDEDESMLNDAVIISRITAIVKHPRQHSYRVTHAQDTIESMSYRTSPTLNIESVELTPKGVDTTVQDVLSVNLDLTGLTLSERLSDALNVDEVLAKAMPSIDTTVRSLKCTHFPQRRPSVATLAPRSASTKIVSLLETVSEYSKKKTLRRIVPEHHTRTP
ncbi:hypothetical protein BC835DRAFT_1522801 [Cytidiella melzeri]|nr:hypothetical protein BC835DRAFT_1522801 [Cytidiella melzeri]